MAWALQHEGPVTQLTKMLGSAARITDEGSDMVVGLMRSTGEMSWAARTMVVDVLAATSGVAREAWDGVQLVNVTITRESGHFVADGPEVLERWILTPEAFALMSEDVELTRLSVAALHGVAFGLPSVMRSSSGSDHFSQYSYHELQAISTSRAQTVLTWTMVRANFTTQWANMLWDLLELAPTVNMTLVHNLLQDHLSEWPVPVPTAPTVVHVRPVSVAEALKWRILTYSRKWAEFISSVVSRREYGDDRLHSLAEAGRGGAPLP